MTETTAGAKARTTRPHQRLPPALTGRCGTVRAVREFAQQGAAYSQDIYEKTKAAAEQTDKALEQTFATATKGSPTSISDRSDGAHNVNAAFDLAASSPP